MLYRTPDRLPYALRLHSAFLPLNWEYGRCHSVRQVSKRMNDHTACRCVLGCQAMFCHKFVCSKSLFSFLLFNDWRLIIGHLKRTSVTHLIPEYKSCITKSFSQPDTQLFLYNSSRCSMLHYDVTFVLPSATTNVNTCYIFRPYWPSSGSK